MSASVRKVAVLYSRLSGYTMACLRALKQRYGVEILVFRWPVAANAPFDPALFDCIDEVHVRTSQTAEEIAAAVTAFGAQVVLVSGWLDRAYVRAARRLKQAGRFVVASSDAQWKGDLRQYAASWVAPRYLHTAFDVLWVTGERQRWMARKLGFRGPRCWSGYYACDWEHFAAAYPGRAAGPPRQFTFVGRYVPVKGLDVLVDAYERYRSQRADPWDLVCAGAGDLAPLLAERPGVSNLGFVQPDALPGLYQASGAFVLPSRREPWGVVVQEAAATGLPLICSDASGASVHLVQDGYNGFVFESGNAAHLATCMQRVSALADAAWEEMSARSFELSKQYTPARWADTLVEGFDHRAA